LALDRAGKAGGIMTSPNFISTRNACKLCMPLGAVLVFKGVRGAVPFLHGSQGCATYIRRYVISHFREPLDVAASNFTEESAIFGGGRNLTQGLHNVALQYQPELIGVASTCLSETIGENLPALLRDAAAKEGIPTLVGVSTPAYQGTHLEGFHAAVLSLVKTFAQKAERVPKRVGLFPGFVSPADLRYLRELAESFGLETVVLPDYSETLDGASWDQYENISPGGTTLDEIRGLGSAMATLELGWSLIQSPQTASAFLSEKFGVNRISLGWPVGLEKTDALVENLVRISGQPLSRSHQLDRGRLVDAYVDAHKVVNGKRAVVFGDADLVAGMAGFLAEIGINPVLCATGAKGTGLEEAVRSVTENLEEKPKILEGTDYASLCPEIERLKPDLLVGPSKGFFLERFTKVPLLRVGFPIHDRFGAARMLHTGYRGTQELLDRIVNLFLERQQEDSPVGYSYQ
jgi:nitrogenase molybdenum-iron protein NifN